MRVVGLRYSFFLLAKRYCLAKCSGREGKIGESCFEGYWELAIHLSRRYQTDILRAWEWQVLKPLASVPRGLGTLFFPQTSKTGSGLVAGEESGILNTIRGGMLKGAFQDSCPEGGQCWQSGPAVMDPLLSHIFMHAYTHSDSSTHPVWIQMYPGWAIIAWSVG